MKNAYVINTPSLPILGNFWHTVRKCMSGFYHLGFNLSVINTDQQLLSLTDSPDNVFFVGDHGLPENAKAGIRNKYSICNNLPQTFHNLKLFPKSLKIFWFYHNVFRNHKIEMGKFVLTGEPHLNYGKRKMTDDAEYACEYQASIPNFVPLTFLSSLKIEQIGTLPRQKKWDAQFVGAHYKTEWTSRLKNCFIRHTGPEIPEEERVASFLNSPVALGFNNDICVMNGTVTERVAEGLAFGNVVLSNNISATEWTDGIVEHVSTFEELEEKIKFYNENEEAFNLKQKQGYNWAKEKGTYSWLAKKFIEKAKEI